ncbi:MAG: PadR family transcriptional regulator [Alphaproteobacteria bacterium]|nr:PadR family transcriptional regulator [Alphaproteobacteria bacterium]
MELQNTQSQMKKGILEFCILSIIKKGEVYPSEILDQMKIAQFQIIEGTLYPLLTRLKNADLLQYRWVESSGGPPRKYFTLTPKGLETYNQLFLTWKELNQAVNTICENHH